MCGRGVWGVVREMGSVRISRRAHLPTGRGLVDRRLDGDRGLGRQIHSHGAGGGVGLSDDAAVADAGTHHQKCEHAAAGLRQPAPRLRLALPTAELARRLGVCHLKQGGEGGRWSVRAAGWLGRRAVPRGAAVGGSDGDGGRDGGGEGGEGPGGGVQEGARVVAARWWRLCPNHKPNHWPIERTGDTWPTSVCWFVISIGAGCLWREESASTCVEGRDPHTAQMGTSSATHIACRRGRRVVERRGVQCGECRPAGAAGRGGQRVGTVHRWARACEMPLIVIGLNPVLAVLRVRTATASDRYRE